MRTHATTAAATLAAGLLLTACSSGPSQEEIAKQCVAALKDRAEGDKSRPSACKGLSEDDYNTLVIGQAIDDTGWIGEDGEVDKNKMLDDLLDDTP
ncbi:hypothetical protein [Streptomyces cucumeris]|uniref:hypothetical protein n=1 Tax=Streptomyces cucumeris TaxID=2962890 RepID=UPI003D73A504